MLHVRRLHLLGLVLVVMTFEAVAAFSDDGDSSPMRIVITNDDGVEELESRIIPLVRRLTAFAEVYVVVPSTNRSGSTHFMSVGSRQRALESELLYLRETEEGRHRVEIHAVDGFPADCVALALRGILKDRPPDLVISGPNGGPNLGGEWIGSGTIGAARMAAYLGVPAVAISGLDDGLELAVAAVSEWVAKLARSGVVQNLGPGQYLTVGIPRTEPSEIQGVRVVPRAPSLLQFEFEPTQVLRGGPEEESRQVWLLQPTGIDEPPPDTDVALYGAGYIVITPMRAYEVDDSLLEELRGQTDMIPDWRSTPEHE